MTITAPRHRRAVDLVRRVPAPLDVVVAALQWDPHRLIGSHLGPPWTDTQLHADLVVELLGGRHVTREVDIGIGPLLEDDGALAFPLWWQAAEHPQLFPTFDGGLELRGDQHGTELRLAGSYRPPLGAVGRFATGLVGDHVVMASLDGFLTGIVARLGATLAGPELVQS
jgi:hypothetical protein